jgi:hypothetical protein
VIHILVGTKIKSTGWTIRVSILGRVQIFFPAFLPLAGPPVHIDSELDGFQRQSGGFGEE